MSETRDVVLIVDDDPQLRSLFEAYLSDQYDVRTAESGTEALDTINDEIDVVLLDRMMPEMSGEETLSTLRDAGADQPVAMITAVKPDFDVFEMDCDEYVVKPVSRDELRDLVETMLLRHEFDTVIREYFGLVTKVTELKQRKDPSELSENEAYAKSKARLNDIKGEARRALNVAIEAGKFDRMYQDAFQDATRPGLQLRGGGEEDMELERKMY